MRAILIDPYNQTVTEQILVGDTLENYYVIIGCDLIDATPQAPDQQHTCYVDDEGLFKRTPEDPMIQTSWHPEPLAGRALIVGFDPSTGASESATLSVEQIAQQVIFLVPGTYRLNMENDDA